MSADNIDDGMELLSTEINDVSMPMLSVVVDFNDLLDRTGDARAYEIVAALKDLLS